MIGRFTATALAGMLAALWLAGCATGPRQAELTVRLGPPVHYTGPKGERFVARYGSLSDDSLHFVKLEMPNGLGYTLPQALSGSGVRYTDDQELVWWTHQGTVRVDVRGADGSWETKYDELREAPGLYPLKK
jgi:Predicted periplasmic protein